MQKKHRFTNIEPISTHGSPVHDYLMYQLQPLKKTLEPMLSQIDQLDHFIKIAETECHFPSDHDLTHDESAAIYLYTMEWGENSLYQKISQALRSKDQTTINPWFAYLKLFDTAIQKLPIVRKSIWCVTTNDIAKNFKKDSEFIWWSINSCSVSLDEVKKFLEPNSTLFLIEAINGKDVSKYATNPNENEVILCPGTRLRVLSEISNQSSQHIVHLQEIVDHIKEQQTSSVQVRSPTNSSKTVSNQKTNTCESIIFKIHIDENGNKYEKLIHILHT